MKTRQLKCYIYTRVSISMQVDGYSLDAQKDKLHKYADYQDMIIAGEYSDEGKSGKSVEGRPQFQQMLSDIESGKDNVDYVLYSNYPDSVEMLRMSYLLSSGCRTLVLTLPVWKMVLTVPKMPESL